MAHPHMEVHWARQKGYLAVYDPINREWHEVQASHCPDNWRNEASARKAAERLGTAYPQRERTAS